jgi:hypothetical protein
MLGNARLIAAAVDLPVQADLENGFGDSPQALRGSLGRPGVLAQKPGKLPKN